MHTIYKTFPEEKIGEFFDCERISIDNILIHSSLEDSEIDQIRHRACQIMHSRNLCMKYKQNWFGDNRLAEYIALMGF